MNSTRRTSNSRVELDELKATDQTLQGLAAENNQLRRALQFRERSAFKLVPARIIARDAATWWSTIKVDKGSNDGVEPDQPVLTEDGLVGKTTVVAGNASTVLLISDENCGVAATVEGTRERGMVRGTRTSTAAEPGSDARFPLEAGRSQAGPEGLLLRRRRRLPRPAS